MYNVNASPVLRRCLEGLGSINSQAFKYFGRGSHCKESTWLESSASNVSKMPEDLKVADIPATFKAFLSLT